MQAARPLHYVPQHDSTCTLHSSAMAFFKKKEKEIFCVRLVNDRQAVDGQTHIRTHAHISLVFYWGQASEHVLVGAGAGASKYTQEGGKERNGTEERERERARMCERECARERERGREKPR